MHRTILAKQSELIQDIVDEADEAFSVKYQMVYSLGNQNEVSEQQLRVRVIQEVLGVVNILAEDFAADSGEHFEVQQLGDSRWSSFMIKESCSEDLYKIWQRQALEKYLKSKEELRPHLEKLKRLVLKADYVDWTQHKDISEGPIRTTVLILRGLFRFHMARLALYKRWRVHYGVEVAEAKNLAIPYKGKDYPAERTEFCNIELTIILTQVYYYLQGMSEDELKVCITELQKLPHAQVLYENWLKELGLTNFSLKQLEQVNL